MKKATKKLSTLFVAMAALFVFSIFNGCTPKKSEVTGYEERALEKGFYFSSYASWGAMCAYTAETNKFDIDNVEMTFYFGARFLLKDDFIDGYDIYFTDFYKNKRIFVRHSDDQFYTEKYSISSEGKGDSAKPIFSYSEKIKIPAEVFSENGEHIDFSLYGDVNNAIDFDLENMCYIYDSEYKEFAFIRFYYRKYGRTVYLFEEYVQSL